MRSLTFLILLSWTGAAFAMTARDCTFYAPFDGAFDAAQARGVAKATVKGSIRFVPGLRGQGILVGAPDTGLRYETKDNLSLEAGTVSVWVKPETWSDSDAAMRYFFSLNEASQESSPQDGGTFVWLYRFFSQSTYFLVWDSRGYPTLVSASAKQFPDLFRKGEWVHLAGTWNGDEIRLFANGKLQGVSRVSTPRILRSLAPTFSVGDPNKAKAADTVLDELRIFDCALTEPEVEALYQFRLEAQPIAQEVTAVRLPTARKVRVDINATGHRPSEANGLSARVLLLPKEGDRTLAETQVPHLGAQHAAAEFSTEGLPPGDYRVVSHLLENGKELAANEAAFSLRPPPAWLGSQIGLSAGVPRPWTPVGVARSGPAATISCWGPRQYAVGDGLFPTGLSTVSQQMLAAPVRLSGAVDGKPLEIGGIETTWQKQTPARVEWESAGSSGHITVMSRQFLEYDGLLWCKLRLSGRGPMKVSKLTLEVPLIGKNATLMQNGFALDKTGAVRKWSHRVVAGSQIWLGNEEGGLQCTIPSARNWFSRDRSRQLEVVPEGDRVTLRLNLVDKEVSLENPLEYDLGWQLTPVRPYPQGWRMWRITPLPDTPGTRFIPFYTEGWAVGTSYPFPRSQFRKAFDDATRQGHRATIYLQPYCVWPGMPDYPDFAAEWRTRLCSPPVPPDPQAPPMAQASVCPRVKSWSDYFVGTFFNLYQGELKDMGWGAVYFDVTQPVMCDNADHGCGYRDEYGVWQGEQPYLENRDVQRRFYRALQDAWPDKLLFNHESGTLNMMQLSHCHGMIDGEHLTLALPPENFAYHNILTLDRMRAEYMGRNFGFVPIFLPEFTRSSAGNQEVTNRFMTTIEPPEVMHLVGLLFLHDILPWNAYSHPGPYFHLWAVQDAFGWGDEVEFLPYWRNRELVTLSPADPNIVCTIYRRPGKALAVVMNNTDRDCEVAAQFNLANMGLPVATTSALDAWKSIGYKTQHFVLNAQGKPVRTPQPLEVKGSEDRIPVRDGKLTLTIAKRNFRMVALP